VVVAVPAVSVVQVAVDQVVDVIAVGHARMAAGWTMDVRGLVPAAGVAGLAGGAVGLGHGDDVLVDVIPVDVVEVAVVQIIDVLLVADGRVTTARAVSVRVPLMRLVLVHRFAFLSRSPARSRHTVSAPHV
jgi:hypothetical protein